MVIKIDSKNKMTQIYIDFDYAIWEKKVDDLIYAECELEHLNKIGEIGLLQKKKIKKILNKLWLTVWDYNPHPNKSLEQSFKLFFC